MSDKIMLNKIQKRLSDYLEVNGEFLEPSEAESLKEEIKFAENMKFKMENQTELIDDYQTGLRDYVLNGGNGDVQVTPGEFVKIYNAVMSKAFDDNDQLEDAVLNSEFEIKWRGIKCSFYNCAAVSNIFITGLKDMWEEYIA